MNTQQPISPAEFKAANYSLEQINPALSAIDKLTKQAIGSELAFKEVLDFSRFLKRIRDNQLSVIDSGNLQYNNRPQHLIDAAGLRLFQIPHDIELESTTMTAKLSARQYKVNSLIKDSFSVAEIDKISPPITVEEIVASADKVAKLQAEAKAIKAFLDDAPRYSLDLLKNTSLSQNNEV